MKRPLLRPLHSPHLVPSCAAALAIFALTFSASIGRAAAGEGDDDSPSSGFREVIPKQERSVEQALSWLSRNQSRDGAWGSNGHNGSYRMAMTGLAGLAFLSAGHQPGRGKYGKNIERAVEFCLKHQQRDGLLTDNDGQSMYGHGFATTFLAQAYGMDPGGERSPKIKSCLEKCVKLIGRAQSSLGGWYYSPNSGSDEGSVTITQVQALRACANNGITVPPKVMKNALLYIHKSQNPDGGIRYSANGGGGSRLALSAAGAELLLMAGQYDSKETKKVLDYLKKNLRANAGQGHDFYTNFYGVQAMMQIGGKDWETYFNALRKRLLSSQTSNGSWADGMGTVYSTSIAVMILSQPYAYLPIFQK